MSENLKAEQHGAVRLLTVNRPEAKNALHGPLRGALRTAMAEADRDDTVNAVVLTGTDPVFSAGVDFKQLERGPGETGSPLDLTPGGAIRAMRKPVICAVNGACVSGALEVALSCSFIVASERARFAARFPDGTWTTVPAAGHNIQEDAPAALADAVVDLIRKPTRWRDLSTPPILPPPIGAPT